MGIGELVEWLASLLLVAGCFVRAFFYLMVTHGQPFRCVATSQEDDRHFPLAKATAHVTECTWA